MKKLILLMFVALALASCRKEGEIAVNFEICNKTNGEMSVEFSSWGDYSVSHEGVYQIPHKFHPTETVRANHELSMTIYVADEVYEGIPPSITPAWNYITSIECMRVKVPAGYFKNPSNWRIYRRSAPFVGESIIVELSLTPEVLAELNKGDRQ